MNWKAVQSRPFVMMVAIAAAGCSTKEAQPPAARPEGLQAERLVDLAKHDYQLEPNVTFTPDQKWIVFRSNMHGASHVYAVEVKKAAQ